MGTHFDDEFHRGICFLIGSELSVSVGLSFVELLGASKEFEHRVYDVAAHRPFTNINLFGIEARRVNVFKLSEYRRFTRESAAEQQQLLNV